MTLNLNKFFATVKAHRRAKVRRFVRYRVNKKQTKT